MRRSSIAMTIGAAMSAASLPAAGEASAQPSDQAVRAEALREEIPNLPHLVRTTPNIYLVRIEKIAAAEETGNSVDDALPPSKVTASVLSTVKGRRARKLTLTVRQRRAGAAQAGLFGSDVGGDPADFRRSPAFFSPERVLSPRNPMFGGPDFKTGETYLVFTDLAAESLLGGPYGYQHVTSPKAFWVRTVKRLVANPDSSHAISMSFTEFIRRHRSAFVMVIGDCLGTEVSISEPLWGGAVSRDDIDPARILPESAADCAGVMDEKRGYLGLIEAKPWLYQVRRGYPNQSYVEIRDGMLDFTELNLDIDFPGDGKISVTELAARLNEGSAR